MAEQDPAEWDKIEEKEVKRKGPSGQEEDFYEHFHTNEMPESIRLVEEEGLHPDDARVRAALDDETSDTARAIQSSLIHSRYEERQKRIKESRKKAYKHAAATVRKGKVPEALKQNPPNSKRLVNYVLREKGEFAGPYEQWNYVPSGTPGGGGSYVKKLHGFLEVDEKKDRTYRKYDNLRDKVSKRELTQTGYLSGGEWKADGGKRWREYIGLRNEIEFNPEESQRGFKYGLYEVPKPPHAWIQPPGKGKQYDTELSRRIEKAAKRAGKYPEQYEKERIERELGTIKPEGLRPKQRVQRKDERRSVKIRGTRQWISLKKSEEVPEDIETTIARGGQESSDYPLSLTEHNPEVAYRNFRGEGKGWKDTTNFNVSQYRRKYKALSTGEASMGFGTVGGSGHAMGVPPEKAKFTVGPNKQLLIKTSDWSPEDPKAAKKGRDQFYVEFERKPGVTRTKEGEDLYEEGRTLPDVLNSLGLEFGPPRNVKGNVYSIYTKEGHHLNPDQQAALREQLDINFGVKGIKAAQIDKKPGVTTPKRDDDAINPGDYRVTNKGLIGWRRKKALVPFGYSQLPKGLEDGETGNIVPGTKPIPIYKNRFGVQFGERDPVKGNLLPGQRESVGMKVGLWAPQYHFREDTDAIGWGTSWRPGQKEITGAVLAAPRAHRNQQLAEAYEASLSGNDKPMNTYLSKYYANDETRAEVDEHRSISEKEGKELVAAGFGAAYYSTKKHLPTRAINYTFAQASRLPKVGSKLETLRGEGGTLIRDIDLGYRKPLSGKIERAKIRMANPLKALRYNPVTKKYEPDPTVPGIMFHNTEIDAKTGEVKKVLNIPSIKYRKRIIGDEEYEIRRLQKRFNLLKSNAYSRERVQSILTGADNQTLGRGRLALWQGRSMLMDPFQQGTTGWRDALQQLNTHIEGYKHGEGFQIKKKLYTLEETPKLKSTLNDIQKEIKTLLEKPASTYSKEDLTKAVENYAREHPSVFKKALPTVGKATAIGGGLAAAGILGVDAYQTYRHKKGEEVRHPILKTVIPERIMAPKLHVQRTSEYKIPDNAVTNTLDLEGQKVPLTGRIYVTKEEKIRLREHKDISGQGYKAGLPLLGHLGVTAPAPVKGSIKAGLTQASSSSGLPTTKNMYVSGKKVPLDISYGSKERWDNKKHKLTASSNPYKISNEDREKLALLASESQDSEDRILSFYGGDQRLHDMVDDRSELLRLRNKYPGFLVGGKKHQPIDYDQIKTRGEGQTAEETAENVRRFRRQLEEHKARMGRSAGP